MVARPTSTERGNLLLAAGAIVALGAILAGCQSRSAYLLAYEEHTDRMATWCYSYLGVRAGTEAGQECIRRGWPNVPPSRCFYYNCARELEPYHRTYRHPHYYARRGPIEK